MSRRRRKRANSINNKIQIKTAFNLNMLLLILIPTLLIGGSVAKYIQERNAEMVYQAKNFYFESDLLSDNTNVLAYTYDTGNDTISFELKNNIDELRHSEVDIEYVASITDIQGSEIKDKNGNVVTSKTGTLSNLYIDSDKIEFTNLPSGNYLITAKAVAPYVKTLQATFVLTEKNENIEYQVSDASGSPILQLTVRTKDYSGNINIIWPSGIAPDNTNAKLSDTNTGYNGGSIKTSFETDSEYSFQFFKKNPSLVYAKNDFTVERSE